MLKKRYAALMIVIALIGCVTLLSFSLASIADSWRSEARAEKIDAQISAEEAEDIALGEIGLDRSEVTLKPTEPDRDKGHNVWEVEFDHGNTEYDFEIDANTGEILEKDKEVENKPKPTVKPEPIPEPTPEPTPEPAPEPTPEVAPELTEAAALEIALADAGLAADAVKHLDIEKDRDDGVWVYEIEFEKDHVEYEYEIRVSDGKILERDIERD